MSFPFSINQPSVNIDILENLRDVISDHSAEMLDDPKHSGWDLLAHAKTCRATIIDADGFDDTFGATANRLMAEIFTALANACTVPA